MEGAVCEDEHVMRELKSSVSSFSLSCQLMSSSWRGGR